MVFFQMCGVSNLGDKGKCTDDLCGVAPLETDAPFEIIEGTEIWHLIWEGRIDSKVNAQFVKAVANCIWENEQVSIYYMSSQLDIHLLLA